MSLDIKITDAIKRAVENEGQPKSVAKRIIAWLEAINTGNEDINDLSQSGRHLDVLFEAVITNPELESDE